MKPEETGFGDKSQVGNIVWTVFWMFLLGWCVLSLFGCATVEPQLLKATGAESTPGYNWTRMCEKNPTLAACKIGSYEQMDYINSAINEYPYSAANIGDWTPIDRQGKGACAAYATAKFEAMAAAGVDTKTLRLAIALSEVGSYHMVLLVDKDGQTWAMDIRYPHPIEYQLLPYVWTQVQQPGTRNWQLVS